ncbi:hypothetical protein Fmac_027291 [Flemingia macrophylla]|uniref:U-box domain-containing protein n=1 Tax=Flemingia macrophylla TaxID=520843 RepID=A0ABD1LHB7_9FABA
MVVPVEEAIAALSTFSLEKRSLAVVWYLASSPSPCGEKMRLTFIELGTISLILEIMVDLERSTCEKALGVFEWLCGCEEGREKAYGNALAVPVLVKKLFWCPSEAIVGVAVRMVIDGCGTLYLDEFRDSQEFHSRESLFTPVKLSAKIDKPQSYFSREFAKERAISLY